MSFTWDRRWGWLCLPLQRDQRRTSCCRECTFRGWASTWTNASLSIGIRLPSRPYWRGSWSFLSVFRQLLRVWELLSSCHHPNLYKEFTVIAWHAPQFSSKTPFPKLASPFGIVTSGSFIYFFFLPPIFVLINKNYNFVDYSLNLY